jgi:hypothetical protein
VASDAIWYVYGIVGSDLELPPHARGSVGGLDDAGVTLERSGNVAALVSVLDADTYGAGALETNTANIEWLSPRALAHDRVLTWASDHGAVIPLPMFSVFSGVDAVRAMLRDRETELASVLGRVRTGREYALRIYRVDADLREALPVLSTRIRELAESAAAASPGQRYLLERKLVAEQRTEMRAVSQSVAETVVAALTPQALDVVRSPIPRLSTSDSGESPSAGTMILNAAFLVAPERLAEFQRVLTDHVEREQPHGFRFDFTGPWPPYHFVREATDGGQ